MLQQQTILVIGGAGYIGSHMVSYLYDNNITAVVLDDLSSGYREAVPEAVPFFQGDLSDTDLLDAILKQYAITAVMHFAAFIEVAESVVKPARYYENNVLKTVRLLNWMKSNAIEFFIFSSTAAVYGEPQSIPITEAHPTQPINPYGASKRMVEQICQDYANAYAFKYIALRYFNAAGAHPSGHLAERHDPETHLIPILLQVALGQRKQFYVYGDDYNTVDGSCVRDFIHVMDLCRAHGAALQYLIEGGCSQVFNVGTSQGCSVKQVIEHACRVTGVNIPYQVAPRRDGDPSQLIADATQLQQICGWQPTYSAIENIIKDAWRAMSLINHAV